MAIIKLKKKNSEKVTCNFIFRNGFFFIILRPHYKIRNVNSQCLLTYNLFCTISTIEHRVVQHVLILYTTYK